ncbi:hypothetical protein DVH24_038440 [Malus domestica]|uniref:Uncharacterized protein n=1 Tax=Malus domestica TaxID=3750 RepID=A0A498K9X7_MALDO|nr:hypothetical protein DVH24_038440 [Malus domestica]
MLGKAQVRETGASSSRSATRQVNALTEEIETLKGQFATQGEQMSMIMSGLQIAMPAPDLAPPSTS